LTVPPETPLAASAVTPARPALLNAGTAPVDGERVALIKKAIESDNYPLVPAKISDAIIAAGLLLRAKK
jgi:negative regulator of flagellin synthesis FlgM